jgi:RNA polymerase sigma-70 factor (ECF subfamily)
MGDLADDVYRRLLVLRCQVGDRGAFEEIVRQCQPRLVRYMRKLLPGETGVDDLIQEVWVDVLRSIARLNDPAAFLPWLYRIAHNRVFEMLRRRQRRPTTTIEELDAVETTTEESDFTFEDRQAVHAAVDQLTPEYREVLLLRFMEDLSYEEIAKVAGCQLGTVRSRLHNAKRALRRIIEKVDQP